MEATMVLETDTEKRALLNTLAPTLEGLFSVTIDADSGAVVLNFGQERSDDVAALLQGVDEFLVGNRGQSQCLQGFADVFGGIVR